MSTAAEVLLIIVSATLSVFLIILAAALIFVIRILRRAEHVADSVESAATAVRRSASAMPFIRLFTNIISRSKKRK